MLRLVVLLGAVLRCNGRGAVYNPPPYAPIPPPPPVLPPPVLPPPVPPPPAVASITYVASTAAAGVTPTTIGVNAGHSGPDAIAWYRRLGVNAVRLFGGAGAITTLQEFSTSSRGVWRTDLRGTPVTDAASFQDAVALLSTPAGHLNSGAWVNPPLLGPLAYGLAQNDTAGPSTYTALATHAAQLRAAGIEPLLVDGLTCATFAFSTLDQGNATYWGEHWELYKHQYIAAQWAFLNGIRRLEFWNEPDLNAACVTAYSWAEHYTLLSGAIQAAFRDANADVASGAIAACPAAACPFHPQIYASAFALADPAQNFGAQRFNASSTRSPYAATYPEDYYAYMGQLTVAGEHAAFPPWLANGSASGVTDAALQNMNVYSLHSYGKTGYQLGALVNSSAAAVAAAPRQAPIVQAALPIATTEHNAHTTAVWNTLATTGDTDYEAARLAGQLAYMAAGGFESYIFKFSAMQQSPNVVEGCNAAVPTGAAACGIQKVGLHWGENFVAPFPIGDATLAAEAARMIIAAAAGGHPLEAITTTASRDVAFWPPPLVVNDGRTRTLVFVNDGLDPFDACTTSAEVCGTVGQGEFAAPRTAPHELTVAFDLAAWGVSSPIICSMAANGTFGEVVAWPLTPDAAGVVTLTLPAFSTTTLTAPSTPFTTRTLSPSNDATVVAGAYADWPTGALGVLNVCTSSTAVHDTTSVALIQFDTAAIATGTLLSAVLALTVKVIYYVIALLFNNL